MIVIRRRAGDSLLIGDDIEIEVLALTETYVKLAIRAPQNVSILRTEIRLIYQQNLEASRLSSLDSIWNL